MIPEPTGYKNHENPFCIDLILTNRSLSFQNSSVFVTGLSDFHRITESVLKMKFQKLQPRIIKYRDYKKFDNDNFREDLFFRLAIANAEANDAIFLDFCAIYQQTINHHASSNRSTREAIIYSL